MVWTLVLFVFVFLEIWAIHFDQEEHDQQQTRELCMAGQNFKNIANRIDSATTKSEAQFDESIGREVVILNKTEDLGRLAKRNLESLTGGSSYAFITPQNSVHPGPIAMGLRNVGKQTLSGVIVTIGRVIKECPDPGDSSCPFVMDEGPMHPTAVGSLSPNVGFEMPTMLTPNADGSGHFFVIISAQNGAALEHIWFRKSARDNGSAFRLTVTSLLNNKKNHKVKEIGWTEPEK